MYFRAVIFAIFAILPVWSEAIPDDETGEHIMPGGPCALPPYPPNGHYTVSNAFNFRERIPGAVPGQSFPSVALSISCYAEYGLAGSAERLCVGGVWYPTTVSNNECMPTSPVGSEAITDDERGEHMSSSPLTGGPCVLPPYPPKGNYTVNYVPGAVPGQSAFSVSLNISCYPGYSLSGSAERLCIGGVWQPTTVSNNECVRFCKLNKDPSVRFRCVLTGSSDGSRECNESEPEGTLVEPVCNEPHYFSKGYLRNMRCIGGQWDNIARCYAECGRVAPTGITLIGAVDWKTVDLPPWHAGIYRKTTNPYMQICGGSLISSKVVISAAHCFWDDETKAQSAFNFAVALGKLYRPWAYKGDQDVQRSNVADIKMSPNFQGLAADFRDDIAILLLASVIVFNEIIRPVCVDFDVGFERFHLSPGNKGKVAGWDLAAETGNASPAFLKVVELPYISIQVCHTDAPFKLMKYITADKFCAGFRNETFVCQSNNGGGGLAFSDQEDGFLRYYLRGIVSTTPKAESLCNSNSNWLTTFTQISRHETFIIDYL